MKYLLLLFSTSLVGTLVYGQSDKAKALVAQMTQEEKVNLVVGMGMKLPGLTENGTGVGQITDKVVGAAGTTFAIPRLGLPNTIVADGPAGLRIEPKRKDDPNTYYATAWPVASLLASTWDTQLVKEVGKAMGNEVKEYGVDVILGPGMNIHRNPLGGRNFEYYSEDPLVSGKMAAAMVNGIQSNGVGTSIKHFAANNQETDRNTVNTIVSERALREIYLRGFEIAVREAQPWTVMSSYNLINGTYTSQSHDLLTTILRKEWGFKGLVMTDWFGGRDAVAQMKAGNDLLMPGTPKQKKAITEALANGSLPEEVLNENTERMVDYILQTPSFHQYGFSNKPDLKAHARLARQAASEGMILLKNNQALPLALSIKKIAAFGNTSYDFVSGGTGSGDVNEEYTISLVEGLTNSGYAVEPGLQTRYTEYLTAEKAKQPKKTFFEEFMNPTPRITELPIEKTLLEIEASTADIAIITLGRNAGEGSDRKVENDFELKPAEKQLIDAVTDVFHAHHKKVVLILNAGGVVETLSWRDKVDGLLLAWQPGLEAGNAVADVLSGKVNPSGRLATSFPIQYEDVPSSKNFPGREFPERAEEGMFGRKAIPAEVTYEEGIYVGYRYFNTFGIKTAYPFGYGLSYTSFDLSSLKLSDKTFKGKLTASVTVKNTGSVPGKEVVQVYLTAPSGKVDKPSQELKAFGKTGMLQPGQSQTLSFTLVAEDLASFQTDRSAWVADPGTYTVRAGLSSEDIRATANFMVPGEIITEKVSKVLQPQVIINELKFTGRKRTHP